MIQREPNGHFKKGQSANPATQFKKGIGGCPDTQFKKGQSGNSKGSSLKMREFSILKSIILNQAEHLIM